MTVRREPPAERLLNSEFLNNFFRLQDPNYPIAPLDSPRRPSRLQSFKGTTLKVSPQTGTYFPPEMQQAKESGMIWNIEEWTRPQPAIPTFPR